MATLYESDVEQLAVELLESQGWFYLSPAALEAERQNSSEVVLPRRLKAAVNKINPATSSEIKDQALARVLALIGQNPVTSNELFHEMLREGITEEWQKGGEAIGVKVRLIDFDTPLNNDFVVCNQFTVKEN
ncbi:MAG: type I restriction endonuclease, partial [Gammaproteobacteria bacterium]|nr:type I restriction endonuclease [Gammaproteobacteria bacterium]